MKYPKTKTTECIQLKQKIKCLILENLKEEKGQKDKQYKFESIDIYLFCLFFKKYAHKREIFVYWQWVVYPIDC